MRLGVQAARLPVIPGEVPQPRARPAGCAFHPRCERFAASLPCARETPALQADEASRQVACWSPVPPDGPGI